MTRILPVEQVDSSSPGSYPQSSLCVGGDGADRVVAQCSVFVGVVYEVVASFFFFVQSSLDGAYPQGAFLVFVDGVDGVSREGFGVLRVVPVVLYGESFNGELVDASVFGTYSDVVAFHGDAVDEVAAQQVGACARELVFDSFEVVLDGVVDVEAFQASDDELLVVGDGEAGQVVLRE